MEKTKGFDPIKRAEKLRPRMIDLKNKKVLLASFVGTSQAKDIAVRTKVVADYFRSKIYEKPEEIEQEIHNFRREPAGVAAERLKVPSLCLSEENKKDWRGPAIEECNNVFLFQLNGCNLNCWYCYVDDINKSANPKFGDYMSCEEILMYFLIESRKGQFFKNSNKHVNVLRISGGEPFLVPEVICWMIEAIEKFDLQDYLYLWVDTNLSTGEFYWKYLTDKQREKVRNYKNIGFMGCYKGIDAEMFSEVTGAAPEFFEGQFKMHRELIDEELDVYTYLYPIPLSTHNLKSRISAFINRMQKEVSPLAPLRMTTPCIKIYTPIETDSRLAPERMVAVETNQHIAMKIWKDEMTKRFGYLADRDRMPHEIPMQLPYFWLA